MENDRRQPPARPGGAPDYKDLEEAYEELLRGLLVAHEEFSREGDGGHAGIQRACHAVVRFLGVRWVNPELASPFLAVHQAFEDLRNGKSPELLSRNVGTRTRSQSSARGEIRFWAAVATELLMKQSQTLNAAARLVGKNVNDWPTMTRGTVTATTIANWRNAVKASPEAARFAIVVDAILRRPDSREFLEGVLERGPPGVPGT